MNATDIGFVLLIIATVVALLGGLGVAGMGADSRHLDARGLGSEHPTAR